MTVSAEPATKVGIQSVPREVQVNILTYLRAYDLSAVQLTCRFFNDSDLIDGVVRYSAEHVYSPQFTQEVVKQENGTAPTMYTLEHLRTIELTVVARVLSSPEPKHGFYVSKSWVKKTLLWLEAVNEFPAGSSSNKKKLNKKQQRQRARRLSDVSPPWPDANSDILCSHQNLQRCGAKAARSRRRLMDKQAWKIVKKLYPASTQLESIRGECLQCLMEAETAKKNEQDRLEHEKLERKKPLADPLVRRFYTRSRGVPTECLVTDSTHDVSVAGPTSMRSESSAACPLQMGTYVILPRAWCHQWRRYMKTGEGGMPMPPDSSALLCDAHKRALLPPHLEAFLCGKTHQLLSTVKASPESAGIPSLSAGTTVGTSSPSLDLDTINALMAAGVSHAEIASQRMAMLQLQQQPEQHPVAAAAASSSSTMNDMLDRENHVVVELVTEEEWSGLQGDFLGSCCGGGCPTKRSPIMEGQPPFAVKVTVQDDRSFQFSTSPCRDCDPTGSRFLAGAEVKYRRKRWEPKCIEQKRIPHVEY